MEPLHGSTVLFALKSYCYLVQSRLLLCKLSVMVSPMTVIVMRMVVMVTVTVNGTQVSSQSRLDVQPLKLPKVR